MKTIQNFGRMKLVMLLFAMLLVMCGVMPALHAEETNVNRKKGLIILVQFSDDNPDSLLSRDSVSELFNTQGYVGRNTGSVRDYLNDQSFGKFDMEFYVTPYVNVNETRAFFNSFPRTITATSMLQYYALEAYANMADPDIPSDLSADASGVLFSTTILYSGPNNGGYSGLWLYNNSPGSATDLNKNNYKSRVYVAGNIGYKNAEAPLGLLIHEMVHLTTRTPDYYYEPYTLKNYCIMGDGAYANGKYTPVDLNPLTKIQQGWMTVVDIDRYSREDDYPVNYNDSTILRYRNPAKPQEYFLIQNIHKSGKWSKYMPANGIAIWHVDESHLTNQDGSGVPRLYLAGTDSKIYSDNRDLLAGDDGRRSLATDYTNPSTRWWDGSLSYLSIKDVSAVGPKMTLSFGNDADGYISYSSPKNRANDKDIVKGQPITFTWTAINIPTGNIQIDLYNGRGFVKNIYAQPVSPSEVTWAWTPSEEFPQRPDYYFRISSSANPKVFRNTYPFRAVKEYAIAPNETVTTTDVVYTISVPDQGTISDIDFRVKVSSDSIFRLVAGYLMLANPTTSSRTDLTPGAVVVGRQTGRFGSADVGFLSKMNNNTTKAYDNVVFDNLGPDYDFTTDPTTRYLNPIFKDISSTNPPTYWQFGDLVGSPSAGDWKVFVRGNKYNATYALQVSELGLRIELVKPMVRVSGSGNIGFGQSYTLNFSLTDSLSTAIEIPVKIEGTALLNTHYTVSGMTLQEDGYYNLVFPPRTLTKDVTLNMVQNTTRIGNKFLAVTLDHSDSVQRDDMLFSHTVNITDFVDMPELQIADTTPIRQNYGTTLVVPLTLSKSSSEAVSIQYSIDGADSTLDYIPAENNVVNIAPGETTANLSLALRSPNTPVSKTFVISLYNPQNTSLGTKNEISVTLESGIVYATTRVVRNGEDTEGINLEWDLIAGKSYKIFRKAPGSSDFTLLDSVSSGVNTYIDRATVPGATYQYYVIAE